MITPVDILTLRKTVICLSYLRGKTGDDIGEQMISDMLPELKDLISRLKSEAAVNEAMMQG